MFAWALTVALSVAVSDARCDQGALVYQEGVRVDGQPIEASVNGDVRLRGKAAACVSCHRRSGYGLADGEMLTPAITGANLFSEREPRRADLLQGLYQEVHSPPSWASQRAPKVRPAYTDETLERALRTGIDPSGRRLDPVMPRYALDPDSSGALIAYLRRLGSEQAFGVDAGSIRFATIIAGQVAPERERAMLDVMEAFIEAKNLETTGEDARPDFSPYYKSEYRSARRRWRLETWRLDGPQSTWQGQLAAFYQRDPVFAVIGGLADGDWEPIAAFCERKALPCLFPNTAMPALREPSHDTLYLSRGLNGEAEAAAAYLRRAVLMPRVLQVVRAGSSRSRRLGDAFAAALTRTGGDEPETLTLQPDDPPSPTQWRALVAETRAEVIAVWLEPGDAAWKTLADAKLSLPLYGCGSLLLGEAVSLPKNLPPGLRVTFPYALPGREPPQIFRVRAWLAARRVRAASERLQLDTYFTMSVLEHALIHMVDHFSRDYLIETIEHETENSLDPGTYPWMSLGPEQRFASKGSYVVTFREGNALVPLSDWIVTGP